MSLPSLPGRTRAEDLPLSRRVIAFATLMIFEFFYGWSWNTVDVLRPQFREALSLSQAQVGSAYTAQGLGALVGAVVLGQLADRFGRRQMLGVVVVGYGAGAVAGAWVANYPAWLGQRFVLGFFLGGIFPVLIGLYMGLFASGLRAKLASLGQGAYNLAIVALGASMNLPFARADWRDLLIVGGAPAVILAPLLFVFVPDDRKLISWGATAADHSHSVSALPVRDLFQPQWMRLTVLLFLLVGLNFFAYQAFAGWTTSYLEKVRGYSAPAAGGMIAWQFTGALLGGFFWGWFSDRFGRRPASLGFFIAAAIVILYLTVLRDPGSIRLAGAAWGFAISSSVAWGPWISEMFPAKLRSTAMSIFNWGRLISMTAPLITGVIADHLGLTIAMYLSAVGFTIAGGVWLLLPETLGERGLLAVRARGSD